MPYTTARIGPKRWGLYHDGRLLATVMTQRSALDILKKLSNSCRIQELDTGISAVVPLKRIRRSSKNALVVNHQ
jgi:hypothetical protein